MKRISFIILLLCPAAALGAKSFLRPQAFPKTMADVNFVDKMNFRTADWTPYANFSPFEYTNLVNMERNMQDEIIKLEKQDVPPKSDENETKTDKSDTTDNKITEDNTLPLPIPKKPEQPTVNPSIDTEPTITRCPNGKPRNEKIPLGQQIPLGNPTVNYSVTPGKYGWRHMLDKDGKHVADAHYGIDISGKDKDKNDLFDTPIYATADGVVEKALENADCAGNYVKIKHCDSGKCFHTFYMHLNSFNVEKGQRVYAGCEIGRMGKTGCAKANHNKSIAAHLHYQIGYEGNVGDVIKLPNGKEIKIKMMPKKNPEIVVPPSITIPAEKYERSHDAPAYSVDPTEFFKHNNPTFYGY
ncbi:MAG: M23 family metallopeptidase [Alphaproteobacteria bacterium]|nr:M23 family metallopeptidase [Alphaproteobacteria bacterium]